jgi:hypothetical protein
MTKVRAGFGLLLVVVAAGALAVASAASDRSGSFEVEKECSQYTGLEGSFCTFTSSNLEAAPAGSKVVYLQPADLASDVILDPPGPGNTKAFGRCELDDEGNGTCAFDGGTGKLKHFRATLAVTNVDWVNWIWEGSYSFDPSS